MLIIIKMFKRRRAYSRTRRTKKYRRGAARASKGYVNRAIARNIENKRLCVAYDVLFNGAVVSAGDAQPVIPTPSQGTYDYQRIGTKFKIKKLVCRMTFTWKGKAGDVSFDKIGVRLMVLKSKRYNTFDDLYTNFAAEAQTLLLSSTGGTAAFDSYLNDLQRPINPNKFRVLKDKVFYMASKSTNPDDLNMAVKVFKFELKSMRNKIVEESADLGVQQDPIFFCVGWSQMDASRTNTALDIPLMCSYAWDMTFEDA